MFKIASPDQTYRRLITVQQPQPDGGVAPLQFTAHFLYVQNHRLNELLAAGGSDYDFLRPLLVGWEDIEHHDGTALAFSKARLKTLCEIRYWAKAVVEEYLSFHAGEPAKNSETPPATG